MDNTGHNSALVDITMPALGADMRDGTLIEWLVKPGDQVAKGDVIAVIETSKGAIEVESYHSGTILELLVEPEIKLPVGSVMARMESDSATNDAVSENASSEEKEAEAAAKNMDVIQASQPSDTPLPPYIAPKTQRDATNANQTHRPLASPAARHQAHQLALDLSALSGSGPQGAVILRDLATLTEGSIEKVVESPSRENTSPTSTPPIAPPSPMRQAISDAMTRSKREIPHYYLALDINLTKAQHWLTEQNQNREPEQRILLPALILSAIARQLTRFPQLNGFYDEGHFTPSAQVNIANTISLREGGLVTPAILNADSLSLAQTMDALRDLTERARHGRLRSSEISQGTITVTSIGERGADMITGVIYPPQVAIIGLGQARKAPIVQGETVEIGDVLTVTLAADHRVSDGINGARFLHALAKQLQHPEAL
ncbi:dihydrolipoamide acetyltransferase family protein [Vibrio japonicus]|uniref:Dihydrolipoamide acetyltransferase component of pyruvate dehydrogenase complex n=1 Tax=Vibrio japonicus TaxID=1824638 RepID=A0ABY5LPM1_9VIBR|nr:dihydrolipoamide acetyltransferase family protein [Vibrio japonicus]UUM32778.1 2-oxo acid dehydrogenase subunit E2 [Vibrio japonicus]